MSQDRDTLSTLPQYYYYYIQTFHTDRIILSAIQYILKSLQMTLLALYLLFDAIKDYALILVIASH